MSYKEFYQLSKEPFHVTPDPEFLYLSNSHKEALGVLIYGISRRKGILCVVGEVGVGKTTILRSYLEKVDREQLKTIYIFNANITFPNLLKLLYSELSIDGPSDNIFEMVNHIHLALIEEYKKGRNVVVIVDEAQNMPVKTLENLRMLSNLETSKEKLIQIVLIGQPELEEKLNRHDLRQFKQRIAIRSTITPLNQPDSRLYIEHRLEKAGTNAYDVFTKRAITRMVQASNGIPRTINILCDNALITGFGYQDKPVHSKIAKEVIKDFFGKRRRWKPSWALSGAVSILLLAILLWAFAGRGQANLQSAARESANQGAVVQDNFIRLSPDQARQLRTERMQLMKDAERARVEAERIEQETGALREQLTALAQQHDQLTEQEENQRRLTNEQRRKMDLALSQLKAYQREQQRLESEAKKARLQANSKEREAQLLKARLQSLQQQNQEISSESIDTPTATSDNTSAEISTPLRPTEPESTETARQETPAQNVPDVDSGVIKPRITRYIHPRVPSTAESRRATGTVLLRVLVTETGETGDVMLIRGIPGFDDLNQAAIEAARKWKFSPATKDGKTVRVWMTYPVIFS